LKIDIKKSRFSTSKTLLW